MARKCALCMRGRARIMMRDPVKDVTEYICYGCETRLLQEELDAKDKDG